MPTKRQRALRLPVFTVGHSTRTLEAFIDLLRDHGVTRLLDVRTIPRSRVNPQFNRDTLPGALHAAGIAYDHLPGLGGLRHPRADPANLAWRNASFRGFADYMQTPEFADGLATVMEAAARAHPLGVHRRGQSDLSWPIRPAGARGKRAAATPPWLRRTLPAVPGMSPGFGARKWRGGRGRILAVAMLATPPQGPVAVDHDARYHSSTHDGCRPSPSATPRPVLSRFSRNGSRDGDSRRLRPRRPPALCHRLRASAGSGISGAGPGARPRAARGVGRAVGDGIQPAFHSAPGCPDVLVGECRHRPSPDSSDPTVGSQGSDTCGRRVGAERIRTLRLIALAAVVLLAINLLGTLRVPAATTPKTL
jgi:hypothetical protein